ncbi:unnamed protein product [Caenorhabditis brenneri]
MFSISSIYPLFVLVSYILTINGVHIDSNDILTECWNQHAAIKLCSPKYDNCTISMNGECLEKLRSCTEKMTGSEVSKRCHEFLSNMLSSVEKNESIHPLELLKKEISPDKRRSEKKRCDVTVFKYHTISPYDLSKLALQAVSQLPSMISTYCQCPKVKKENKDSFVQSSKSSVSSHFWYGGFRNYECWKDADRNLAELLCGETTSLLINHEWAKRADCLENPKWFNCTLPFMESLEMAAKSSEKPLFCFVYVEIIDKYLKVFDWELLDYEIVYLKDNESRKTEKIPYRDEELYLFEHPNEETTFQCFSIKRTLNSCKLLYNHHNTEESSMPSYINCIEKNEHLVSECVFILLQKESFGYLSRGFFKFVWDHKWTTLVFILIGAFCALCKKVRDWILKLLAIRACVGITKSFMKATEYSDNLLNKTNNQRIRSETMRTLIDEESYDESTNTNNQRETSSQNNQEWQSLAPVSPEVDDSVSVIGLDPQTPNNQQEVISSNAQNNCETTNKKKEDGSKKSTGSPEVTPSFNEMWRTFQCMVRSYSQVVSTLYIYPAFNSVKESVVNYFATPRTNGNIPL